MRYRLHLAGWLSAAALAAVLGSGVAARADSPAAEQDQTPSFLPFSYPPDGSHMMGDRNGSGHPETRSAVPGITAPLVPPPAGKTAETPPPPRSQAQVLDDLFQRLATAEDAEQAKGVATRIEHVWLLSGSDTAELLMSRAIDALGKGSNDVALQVLDKVVALQPDWVEAWNKRATVRFLGNDDFGSMEDIVHVLSLEPRHFGALSGMGIILQRQGMKKEALATLRKAAVIYPHNDELQKMIESLTPEVEGRGI